MPSRKSNNPSKKNAQTSKSKKDQQVDVNRDP